MKSFILSSILTAFICVYVVAIFDQKVNAHVRSLPDWFFIVVIAVFFIGYLLSLYWGITGIFKQQRLFNLAGICLSLFGLGLYVFGFIITNGSGKESKGQFDHDISKIETNQRLALDSLLEQTNTNVADVQMVQYWGMYKNPSDFAICIQKGDIISLQVKNKTITDINKISKLRHLNWLILENCNIESIDSLKLPLLQRLSINHNKVKSLSGLENSPNLAWLNFRNNPITDSSALKYQTNKYLYIANENE